MTHDVDIMRLSGTELSVCKRLPVNSDTDDRFSYVDRLGHLEGGARSH